MKPISIHSIQFKIQISNPLITLLIIGVIYIFIYIKMNELFEVKIRFMVRQVGLITGSRNGVKRDGRVKKNI